MLSDAKIAPCPSSSSSSSSGPAQAQASSPPTDSDVLCGRGGAVNVHPGNARYRQLVAERKRAYLAARSKREKRLLSESVVEEIRNQSPPGRFLGRRTRDGADWYDIGAVRAREKTSQALRENLPKLRREIEAEKEAAAAKKKEEEEEEQQERLWQQQQLAGSVGYSYGHHPYAQLFPAPNHHYMYEHAAPPSSSPSPSGPPPAS